MAPPMKQPPKPPLDPERVRALRGECEAFIDQLAAKEAKSAPGVPVGVIRNLITARSNGCACAAYLAAIERGA